jgi:hypothetical protein
MVDRFPKGTARRALCIDYVMLVEHNEEALDRIEMLGVIARDGRSNDQVPAGTRRSSMYNECAANRRRT